MADRSLMTDLGRELRRGRVEAGYRRQSDLAVILQVDRSAVSRAESGARVPADRMLRDWCEACRMDYGRMATLARGARGSVPEWFEGWRDVEARSAMLAYWDCVIMPAVARSEPYVRAVLGAGGVMPADAAVYAQLGRASVAERAEVVCVVHEVALRRFVGSPEVMTSQLAHLAAVAESLSVHVHVVPNNHTVPGMSGAFSLAHDLGVVHMDGMRGRTTNDPDVFRDAGVLFERIRAHALPRDASRDLIVKVGEEWMR